MSAAGSAAVTRPPAPCMGRQARRSNPMALRGARRFSDAQRLRQHAAAPCNVQGNREGMPPAPAARRRLIAPCTPCLLAPATARPRVMKRPLRATSPVARSILSSPHLSLHAPSRSQAMVATTASRPSALLDYGGKLLPLSASALQQSAILASLETRSEGGRKLLKLDSAQLASLQRLCGHALTPLNVERFLTCLAGPSTLCFCSEVRCGVCGVDHPSQRALAPNWAGIRAAVRPPAPSPAPPPPPASTRLSPPAAAASRLRYAFDSPALTPGPRRPRRSSRSSRSSSWPTGLTRTSCGRGAFAPAAARPPARRQLPPARHLPRALMPLAPRRPRARPPPPTPPPGPTLVAAGATSGCASCCRACPTGRRSATAARRRPARRWRRACSTA